MSQPVALVTGGTRRIGLAVARRLAQAGHALVLVYRQDDRAAAEAAARLRPLGPVHTVRADVSHPDGAHQAVEAAQQRFGRVDVLVNAVGPFLAKPLAETTPDEWAFLLHGNLSSAFYTMRLVIPLMRAQGGGVIVNLGSLNAGQMRGAPGVAAYQAAKAALVVLTRSVARSEGPYGIRANVVNPGIVDPVGVDPDIVGRIPLRRLATPEDVAAAVAWLCSPEAAYVNGAVLDVHGGLWA